MRLWLDYETRGHIDIKVGTHPYAMRSDLLLAAYAIDDGPVKVWQVHFGPPPRDLLHALASADEVWAHGAEFDYAVHEVHAPRHGLPVPPFERLCCSMTAARAAGLVGDLDIACRALGLPGKTPGGKSLMTLFCIDHAKIEDHPEEWQRFVAYAVQDVVAMRALAKRLPPLPERERRVWRAHARINRRGVRADLPLARAISAVHEEFTQRATDRCRRLTGIKATQRDKLRYWLIKHGLLLPNMQESTLADLHIEDLTEAQAIAIAAWRLGGRRAAKKADSILSFAGEDDRLRDNFAIFGAANGRWSSKGGVQLHNLPRPRTDAETISWLLELLSTGRTTDVADLFERWSSDPALLLASCVRGLLIPSDGHRLHIADFSKIELLLLFHAAGETQAVQRLLGGADLYRELYAERIAQPSMDPADVPKNGFGRAIGKAALLGCGYGLGQVKFARMNKIQLTLAAAAVTGYRTAYPRVPALWRELEQAAIDSTRDGRTREVSRWPGVQFERLDRWLTLSLPSGRCIYLFDPRIQEQEEPFHGWQLVTSGPPNAGALVSERLSSGLYTRRFYGGALTEYLICGCARDLLADALVRLDERELGVIAHVHDEAVIDSPPDAFDEFTRAMLDHESWARGWGVSIEAGSVDRYRKLD